MAQRLNRRSFWLGIALAVAFIVLITALVMEGSPSGHLLDENGNPVPGISVDNSQLSDRPVLDNPQLSDPR